MAVDVGAAVSGNMLDNRYHTAGQQPFAYRLSQSGDRRRFTGKRPVADNLMAIRKQKIYHGSAINVEPAR